MNYKLARITYLWVAGISLLLFTIAPFFYSDILLNYLSIGSFIAIAVVLVVLVIILKLISEKKYSPQKWQKKIGYLLLSFYVIVFTVVLIRILF